MVTPLADGIVMARDSLHALSALRGARGDLDNVDPELHRALDGCVSSLHQKLCDLAGALAAGRDGSSTTSSRP
ncbi:hypothetical protein [Candidatus Dormiibacter inghamiae]|uniref:hypothetical protein n=1 Tax=Candidatus Dormiibacter inghamiae TaxID=3127013 RepID=UPI0030C6BE30